MLGDKIVSLVDKLRAKKDENLALRLHLERSLQARHCLAEAIETMRSEGIPDDEIAAVLRYAADFLGS